jgi:phage baseplate assembly protein W
MFRDTITELPYNARTPEGSGFFPPMVRAIGHLLVLLEYVGDPDHNVTDEEVTTELSAAIVHWESRTSTENVSTRAIDTAHTIFTALSQLRDEFPDWNEDQRITNLRDLIHRILQYVADLDRELVGLTGSDPGSTL